MDPVFREGPEGESSHDGHVSADEPLAPAGDERGTAQSRDQDRVGDVVGVVIELAELHRRP